jgi:hypothetical protein
VRFQVLTAVAMNITGFSDMMPCSLVDRYRRFGETYAASIFTQRLGCSSYFLATSESELLYDWRFTANQFVLATSPLRPTTSNFIFQVLEQLHLFIISAQDGGEWSLYPPGKGLLECSHQN